MKKLTVNRLATAGLRVGKRAYLSLAAGIFLSIFLVSALCLAIQGIFLAQEEKMNRLTGYQDCFILDSQYTAGEVMETGFFDRIGMVYAGARIGESDKYLGWYDDEASDMLSRRLTEGRMPEKTGEIAVEQSMLAYFEWDKTVGDELTLSLTPVDGVEETRSYIITGILEEQTAALDVAETVISTSVLQFPAAIVHGEEAFSTGRTAVHCVLTLKDERDAQEALNYWMYERMNLLFYILPDGSLTPDAVIVNAFHELFQNAHVFYLLLIVASLLLACGVGIAQALESRLAKRIDQIGMLRAVGATRRQIRRIFGREAWLLMLILLPAGVLAGCLVILLFAWMLPEEMVFRANPVLLMPVALVSGLCILISASLPLRRASQIMPMSVIRDTELLRKSQSIRTKAQFNAPGLIAARQMRLRGARQVGASLLVMLMLVTIAGAAGFSAYDLGAFFDEEPDFEVYFQPFGIVDFEDIMPQRTLTDQDMAQIRSLPHVVGAQVQRSLNVNLLLSPDEIVPGYLRSQFGSMLSYHLSEEDDVRSAQGRARHEEAKKTLGVEGTLVPVNMLVLTDIDAEAFRAYITDGEIDMKAVDEGREVLVYAPDIYETEKSITFYKPEGEIISSVLNDAYCAGQTLDIRQLWRTEQADEIDRIGRPDEGRYDGNACNSARTTVGAVIGGSLWKDFSFVFDPCILTTEKGVRAMGLEASTMHRLEIYTDGDANEETERYLADKIHSIASRADLSGFQNYLEMARENRETQRQLTLVLVGVAVVFLSAAFSLIAGNIRRGIRSDERMIGTLRAVGADERMLISCYSRQVMRTILIGFAAAAVIFGAVLLTPVPLTAGGAWNGMAAMLAFTAVCLATCRLAMKRTIREITKKSIVENIREL